MKMEDGSPERVRRMKGKTVGMHECDSNADQSSLSLSRASNLP